MKGSRDVVNAHLLEQAHGNWHIIAVELQQSLVLRLVVAMSAIFGVSLLILADVSLPAEISSVYRLNQQVHLIRRLVLKVHIVSLLRLLSLNVLVLMMARAVLNQRLSDSVLVLGERVFHLGLRSRTVDQIDSLNFLMRRDRVPLQLSVIV